MPPPSECESVTTWAWLAGLFDGEGSIDLHYASNGMRARPRRYLRCCLVIHMANRSILEAVAERTKIGRVRPLKLRKNRLQMCEWKCGKARQARMILRELLPYLIVKRAEAILAISLIDKKRGNAPTLGQRGFQRSETIVAQTLLFHAFKLLRRKGTMKKSIKPISP